MAELKNTSFNASPVKGCRGLHRSLCSQQQVLRFDDLNEIRPRPKFLVMDEPDAMKKDHKEMIVTFLHNSFQENMLESYLSSIKDKTNDEGYSVQKSYLDQKGHKIIVTDLDLDCWLAQSLGMDIMNIPIVKP